MSDMNPNSGSADRAHGYIPRPETITPDYMLETLIEYYNRKWNPNENVLRTLKNWHNWDLMLRMPDILTDYTVSIEAGKVENVGIGIPAKPRILTIMLAETQQRIYYDETTAAIESIAGRIKIRGDETEKRRLLAAISYLTW
jgi:hypothetical protein